MADFINCYTQSSPAKDQSFEAPMQQLFRVLQCCLHNDVVELATHPANHLKSIDGGDSNMAQPLIVIMGTTISILSVRQVLSDFCLLDTRIVISEGMHTVRIESTFLKNGLPLAAPSRKARLLLMRYLNKLNSVLEFAFFKVHSENGCISLVTQLQLSKVDFIRLIVSHQEFINEIRIQTQHHENLFLYNLHIISYLAGRTTLEQMEYFANNTPAFRMIRFNTDTLQTIEKAVLRSHEMHAYMRHPQLERLGMSNAYILEVDFDAAIKHAMEAHQKLLGQIQEGVQKKLDSLLEMYNMGRSSKGPVLSEFSGMDIKNFVGYLMPTNRTVSSSEKPSVYNQIELIAPNTIRWQPIGEGGFSKLHIADVSIIYIDHTTAHLTEKERQELSAKHIRKRVVKKTELSDKTRKVEHQKLILSKIHSKMCPYIARFYHTQQQPYEKALFLDFCHNLQLNKYIANNRLTVSTVTLLYLLRQASQALRFVALNNIQHLDIKPQNILITKNLVVNLSDFGESYHRAVCPPGRVRQYSGYRHGYTLPYTAPEIFKKEVDYSPALDVFSFGHVLHKLIFGMLSYDLNKERNEKLKAFYTKGSASVQQLIVPERAREAGNSDIMELIGYLANKCMRMQANHRANIDWTLVILQLAFGLVDPT